MVPSGYKTSIIHDAEANTLGGHLDLEVGINLTLSGSVSGVERLYSANDTAYDVLALRPSQTAEQFEDVWCPVTARPFLLCMSFQAMPAILGS